MDCSDIETNWCWKYKNERTNERTNFFLLVKSTCCYLYLFFAYIPCLDEEVWYNILCSYLFIGVRLNNITYYVQYYNILAILFHSIILRYFEYYCCCFTVPYLCDFEFGWNTIQQEREGRTTHFVRNSLRYSLR
jgi:hypothetical protein